MTKHTRCSNEMNIHEINIPRIKTLLPGSPSYGKIWLKKSHLHGKPIASAINTTGDTPYTVK